MSVSTDGNFSASTLNPGVAQACTVGNAVDGTTGALKSVEACTDVTIETPPVVTPPVVETPPVVTPPEVIDSPTTITQPTLGSRTSTTLNMIPGTFVDADDVQNVVVALYMGDRTTRVGTAVDGKFTGLTSGYGFASRMEGQAKNKVTGVFEDKTSTWKNVSTLSQ